MKSIFCVLLLLMLFNSSMSWAATTYITIESVNVLDAPNGLVEEQWPDKTLFTSSEEVDGWITITGSFPEGVWQPLEPSLYIQKSTKLKERIPYQHKSAKTVVYKALKKVGSNAKAYKLLEDTKVFFNKPKMLKSARTKRAIQINDTVNNIELEPASTHSSTSTESQVLKPVIKIANFEWWNKDMVITSTFENRHFIKVTGYFPDGTWTALTKPVWIKKPVKLQNRTQPRKYERKENSKRFAIIDKSKFELSIYEVVDGEQYKLMRTPVALGYDRCLSAAKGGKCYYTPEGEYEIEFKLFDPDGITWCIPPKMEAEFKSKLARGERCWRGVMGNYAMHFGDSLFLHGTSNPSSIGSRSTHGCVRLRNPDIEMVYQMLGNGDKVLISETPEQFNLIELAQQSSLEKRPVKESLVETQPVL